jgi:RNA polymerase I-specific transcription initiation factor RRN3
MPQLITAGMASPVMPKPILRKPAPVLGRRKTEGGNPTDEDLSPTKRRKVIFDDLNNSVHEPSTRHLRDIKAEVKKTLEERIRGEDEEYVALKKVFAAANLQRLLQDDDVPEVMTQELTDYVIALTACVGLLKSRACKGLALLILECSWLGRDEVFVKAYIQFLAALISAQGSYISTTLSMIVDAFRDAEPSAWEVPGLPEVSQEAMQERLHACLRYLLKMFPAAKQVLCNLITDKLPHSGHPKESHISYVNNLLRLKDYAPDMEEAMMDLIVSHVVKIDVQIQVDLEDLGDAVPAPVACLLDSPTDDVMKSDDADDDVKTVSSDDSLSIAQAEKMKFLRDCVEIMDAILDTLFEFYSDHFKSPGSDAAIKHYTILVREFTEILLPTLKSRHTQFLLFHFGQKSEQLIDAFCGTCISIAFQSNRPNMVRQAAATYLASFVARGAHLSGEIIRTVFDVLLHQMDLIRETHEPRCRGPDFRRYQTYYALCQAVFYIFCFRWRDLVVSSSDLVDRDDPLSYLGQELEWIPDMKEIFLRNIYSKLNPLKVCAPSVVEQFAKLAHRLNFLYVFPLLSSNKRIRLSQYLSDTYANGGALRDVGEQELDDSFHQLDPYFPFDPYQLPISKRWVELDYLEWQQIPGLNIDDDGEDSDETNSEQDDGVTDNDMATDDSGDDEDND